MKQAAIMLGLATLVALVLVTGAQAEGFAPPWIDLTDDVCVASASPTGEGFDELGRVGVWGLRTASGVVVFDIVVDWCHGWSAP